LRIISYAPFLIAEFWGPGYGPGILYSFSTSMTTVPGRFAVFFVRYDGKIPAFAGQREKSVVES
jgi:hypothetical protein